MLTQTTRLTNIAEKLGYHSQIILSGRKVNDSMGSYVADMAIKAMIEAGQAPKRSTVLILGLTFKENCPDIRNSKVIDIIHRLREYDINPVICDPWADPEAALREYNVQLQKEEVEEVSWFPLKEVYEEIQHDRSRFCVPSEGIGLLKDALEKYRQGDPEQNKKIEEE